MLKSSHAQKCDRLRDCVAIEQHQGVRRLEGDVIGHAFELRAHDRNPAVIRPGKDEEGCDRIERPVAGNDADRTMGQWKLREKLALSGSDLLTRWSIECAEWCEIPEEIGDLAAIVRRSQHDDAREAAWPTSGKIGAR